MKKALQVTIAGALFTIEEDAYASMYSYLTAIAHYFDALPEGGEVKHDIEARVAEQIQEQLEQTHTVVVTGVHVHRVIEIMGTVEEITESAQEDRNQSGTAGADPTTSESEAPRRLFRDVDHGVVAGVCSGIAAYFDIDPVIVRIVFVVMTFVSAGAMILLYIIIAFIMPKAQTAADKIRMRGGPVTLSSFKETLHEAAQNMRKNGEEFLDERPELRRRADRTLGFFESMIRPKK